MIDDEILHKWINGSISEEELLEFRKRPEYKSLERLFQQTEGLETPEFDRASMLKRIQSAEKSPGLATGKSEAKFVKMAPWLRYGIVACFLIIGGILFWPKEVTPPIITLVGEQITGQFPDGSKYTLNANSHMDYDLKGFETNRVLTLHGEAFFSVLDGSSFVVNTDRGKVTVLGTEFNVNSRDDLFHVACVKGEVQVNFKGKREVIALMAGDACRLNKDGRIELREAKGSTSWLDGITKLKDVPIVY